VDGVEREVDNEALDLIVYVGMRLMGWLEVVSLLGCGSFGQVFLCKDLRICDGHFVHPGEIGGVDYEYWNCSHAFLPFSSVDIPPTNPPLVAVKVVKSVPLLEQQSVLEAEMLVLIGAQTAPAAQTPATALEDCNAPPPEDPRCAYVAKVLADGICYGHHCIVMERYGANLYEYIASNEHLGLPMYQIRSIGYQLFTALSLIHEECHIIHADIKPENMLLTLNSSRGVVRTNETSAPAPAGATAAPSPEGVTLPPPTSPPRNVQRAEEVAAAATSTTCSLERSYITLRTGPTAAGRHRHSRRSSGVPLDASTSTLGRSKGQSFCHLRSSMTSRLTVVEQTNVPAPEPRRVQSLNQSAGMLPSRNVFSAQVDAPSFSSLAAAGGGKSAPAAAPSSLSSMAPRLHVKLIDFSSSCYDGGPFYQYIQSRYYRAPEVIVGASYGSGIDIWSSGCLLAELLLGMPLLPGCNDHHQLCLIEEMVGPLPTSMVQEGVNTELYYKHAEPAEEVHEAAAQSPTPPPRPFALRSREEFLLITQSEPQPYRRYFTYQTLQELVRHCPLTLQERRMSNGLQPYVPANESAEIPPNTTPSPSVRSEMMKQRFLLFDLLRRLLQTDPTQRPTASRVLTHPFFTSAPPYMKTFMLE
jgi:serine/threonine protein kinase